MKAMKQMHATTAGGNAAHPGPRRHAAGYTLIELVVVMAIIAILALAALPLAEAVMAGQRERDLRASLVQIRDAIDDYKRAVDRGAIARVTPSGYPPSLQALVDGAPDIRPGHEGQRHHFLRRLPADPLAPADVPAAGTWRLRSHASPPHAPAPGADVYDVRSSSDGVALDGSAHAQW